MMHIYFIANNNDPGDGVPTLKRAELGTNGTFSIVPLVEGIENLQFEYGLDTNGDGMPDAVSADPGTYNGCAADPCYIANWLNVDDGEDTPAITIDRRDARVHRHENICPRPAGRRDTAHGRPIQRRLQAARLHRDDTHEQPCRTKRNMMRHRHKIVARHSQRGVTLVVGMIMLVLITLLVLASFHLGRNNLEIVGNAQQRNEALAAAQQTIEAAVNSPLLTSNPAAIFPTPCAG